MKYPFYVLATAVLFSFTSCDKDNESDEARAAFSIKRASLSTKQPNATIATNTTGVYTFSKVMLGLNEIDFEMEVGGEDEDFELKGPFQYNVLTQKSTPTIDAVPIVPGKYHELEFEIDDVLPSGNSIEIAGTYMEGSTTYKFEFTSTMEEDFDIDSEAGINATIGKTANFVLQLNLESLFQGIDFSRATAGSDNVIYINKSSNAELASLIEDRVEETMDLDID